MLSYLVIAVTLVLLLLFVVCKVRTIKNNRHQNQELFCLFVGVEKEEANDGVHYYGSFQIREEELRLEIPRQLFLNFQQPQRGKVIYHDEVLIAFET